MPVNESTTMGPIMPTLSTNPSQEEKITPRKRSFEEGIGVGKRIRLNKQADETAAISNSSEEGEEATNKGRDRNSTNKETQLKRADTRNSNRSRREKASVAPNKISANVLKFDVGRRVLVYWAEDDDYFEGTVTWRGRKRQRGQVFVDYDDGDGEWVDVQKRKVKLADSDDSRGRTHASRVDVSNIYVESRVSVWWPAEEEYFDATVTDIDDSNYTPFFLEYDDGDSEWTNLAYRTFNTLP
mmetsp:Transcript_18889/g.31236  ORF Transcript_18889/g.31236 Transcript_18889/m.31236 type:complete len:241 (+) Transcript_18889:50-772(+)